MSAGEFIPVFALDDGAAPFGIYVEGPRFFLAVPWWKTKVHNVAGFYFRPDAATRTEEIEVNGEIVAFELFEWTKDFDRAVVDTINRLAMLRWSLPSMRQLPLQLPLEGVES